MAVTGKIDALKAKLMSFHEKLADLKMTKTELQTKLEEESSSFSQQEEDLVSIKDTLQKHRLDLKEVNRTVPFASKHRTKTN